jgi:galactose mutarotase-like enzyme
MNHTISNEFLTVTISSQGAEMMSIQHKNGLEYLWQADPIYWSDRAIHIFPYVARLTNGSYIYQNKTYQLPIHGFVPNAPFTGVKQNDSSIVFTLNNPESYVDSYPFLFDFSITYTLDCETIHVQYHIHNKDTKTMFFGLGGHPGFRVPLEDGLSFEDYQLSFPPCNPKRVEFTPACFITEKKEVFPLYEQTLPLSHQLFDEDAIVLTDVPHSVTLSSPKGKHGITLIAPDFRYFGFWHTPRTDAPFLCMEPWSSLPAKQDIITDIEKQNDLLSLPPQETFTTLWSLHCF